jgi:hypothetical protein
MFSMVRFSTVTAMVSAFMLAGCGGHETAALLERGAVWHCLGGSGPDVNTNESDLDYIAQDAAEGGSRPTAATTR